MQQRNWQNMDIKFQALWDNLVAEAMDSKAQQIIIYNYMGRQTIYLKGSNPKDNGYKKFQPENTFLENHFNDFSEYVYTKLNINRRNSSSNGEVTYQNIPFTYSFNSTNKDNFIYLSISANKAEATEISLKDLGFTTPQVNEILNIINKDNTGILISSLTGNGKTSTAIQICTEIAKNYNLISIENLENANAGFVLRSDIDRVSIGELRTFEHLQELSKIREHGCQVIATIHANSPLQSIERIHSLSKSQAHKNFDLLIYQTLINKLCPYCSIGLDHVEECLDNSETAHEANYYNRKVQLKLKLKKLYQDVDLSAVKVKNHDGCVHCKNKGISGLTVCASVVPIDPRMHELIDEKEDVASYLRLMADENPLSDNMAGKSAKEHAVYHMLTGVVDPEDVYEKFSYL